MPWPKTAAFHYHAQLGLSCKGRAINRLVVCYVVWLRSRMGFWTSARSVVWSLVEVRMAIELKYRNTPIDSYKYISHKK